MTQEAAAAAPVVDEERCRRRGTPNWRCPQRALPGKTHCLKHYLSYVSRRHRLKAAAAENKPTTSAPAYVEPYRPVIDFDPPVQNHTVGYGPNDQTALHGCWSLEVMINMTQSGGGVSQVALGGGGGGGGGLGNDCFGPGGVLEVKREDGVVSPGPEMLMGKCESAVKKRGRPKGSKTKKNKGDDHQEGSSRDNLTLNVGGGFNHHDLQGVGFGAFGSGVTCKMEPNLSWVMRDKDSSDDSDNEDQDSKDQRRPSLDDNRHDYGVLWSDNIGNSSGSNNIIRNGACMTTNKKRGRPKGSKNKPKWVSL